MNKKVIIWIIGIIIVIGILVVVLRGFSGEDDWIKDSNGVYIKHGNPSNIPENVKSQQEALKCADELYNNFKSNGIEINSQCLGVCNGYAVDIAHVPRTAEDNKAENQCTAYINGEVIKFIELDKSGNVVRVNE